MNAYGGIDMKMKGGMGGGAPKGNKAAPRPGAAKGQGAGMGGYNAGTVGKAMASVPGGGGKPTYFMGAGAMRNKK